MNLQPGDRLGPYLIEDEIGRGGFATVYRAHDPRFGGPVAIKVLAGHLSADHEAVERFLAEARALRSVESEAIVGVFDIAATDDDQPYMVLQHANRGTLLERLMLQTPASDEELRHVVAFFEQSLGVLHEREMVHRDVKPSNVLITSIGGGGDAAGDGAGAGGAGRPELFAADERLVLGDLGLVKDLSASSSVTRGSGSAAYAAPEQRAVVSRVDTRSDLYAATAVVAELALGRFRRADETWDHVCDQIDQARGKPLAEALRSGLAEDPTRRPSDIGAWASALTGSLSGADVRPNPLERSADGTDLRRRVAFVPAAVVTAAVLVIALVIGSVIMLNRPDRIVADGARTTSSADAVLGEQVTAVPELDLTWCQNPERGVATGNAPAGVTIAGVTDTTVTVEWEPEDRAFSLFVGGRYVDNLRKNADQYVVEGLGPETVQDVVIAGHDVPPEDDGAMVCAVTLAPGADVAPLGLTMATDLAVTDLTSTTATLTWTAAGSGGRYTLYSGNLPEGKNFPTIKGAGGVPPEENSFVFEELEPGSDAVIGLRTVQGENQSGLAWITIDLPAN